MTDVLGARLTLSDDMKRAQARALAEMGRIGLVNVSAEPCTDYEATWDSQYMSLHLVGPDYTTMVEYPLAHTPGTNGRQSAPAMIAEIQSKADLTALTGEWRTLWCWSLRPSRWNWRRSPTACPAAPRRSPGSWNRS